MSPGGVLLREEVHGVCTQLNAALPVLGEVFEHIQWTHAQGDAVLVGPDLHADQHYTCVQLFLEDLEDSATEMFRDSQLMPNPPIYPHLYNMYKSRGSQETEDMPEDRLLDAHTHTHSKSHKPPFSPLPHQQG